MPTAPSFDPDDTTAIGVRLAAALGPRIGPVSLAAGPKRIGGGIDTYVYGFKLNGDGLPPEWRRRLILRIYPSPDQGPKAEREFSVQEFVASTGYPAPRPLLVDPEAGMLGLPVMIMERLPGTPMLDRLKNPLLIPGMLTLLAETHARLHELPVEGWPLSHDGTLVDRRLAETEGLVQRHELKGPRKPLGWLRDHSSTVQDEALSLCHIDFHPLNVLVDKKGRVGVVDWSDSDVGDRHADVARTTAVFWLAPPLARSAVERTALQLMRRYAVPAYLRRYEEHLPVDRDRLRYWQVYHATHAWAQILVLKKAGAEALGARPEPAETLATLTFALKAYIQERIS